MVICLLVINITLLIKKFVSTKSSISIKLIVSTKRMDKYFPSIPNLLEQGENKLENEGILRGSTTAYSEAVSESDVSDIFEAKLTAITFAWASYTSTRLTLESSLKFDNPTFVSSNTYVNK